MTQTSAPTNKLRLYVKWALISLFLVAAIWFIVILWWQTTQRVVTLEDALLYLLVLPLGILIGIGIIQIVRHLAKKIQKAKALSKSNLGIPSNSLEQGNMTASARERALKLSILSAWGITSLADNAEDFVQALIEKRSRPRPDRLLLDDRGFPLPSGRVMDLDTSAIEQSLIQAIALNGYTNIPDSDEWRDAFLRALALLTQVLDQARNDWPLNFDRFSETQSAPDLGTLRGAPALSLHATQPLSMQVKLLISADFHPYEKQLALTYLLEQISTFHIPQKNLHVEIVSANDDATALSLADQFNLHVHRNGEAQALLLLACDSTLCTSVTEDWQYTGRLFSTHCPNGLMMGEAAFGILCVNDKALSSANTEPACHLARVSHGTRELSADTPGKPSYVCLTQAVNDALASAAMEGEMIGTVACDADHRTNRTLECMGAMMKKTPQLDAIENRLAANEACGHIGCASVLGVLVAGVIQVKNANHPVLLFNVSHMAERAAAVLIPTSEMPQPS